MFHEDVGLGTAQWGLQVNLWVEGVGLSLPLAPAGLSRAQWNLSLAWTMWSSQLYGSG